MPELAALHLHLHNSNDAAVAVALIDLNRWMMQER
jgi:hypothetical protein